MRTAFITELSELAARDPRITLVVGDLGYSVVEPFAARFPGQYVNAGVAEQNMTGLAAGLALAGRIVFTYSIANFPTLRCIEQVRNDVCYHNLPVTVVAVGGGFAYGALGVSHHATEDLAIMRALPNMTVFAPGDPLEAGLATRAAATQPGPCYLRLGKAGERVVHAAPPAFEVGRAIHVREGRGGTLLSTGAMLPATIEAADLLARAHGLEMRVLSVHTLKPLDVDAVTRAALETPLVVTIEEHSVVGGLGSAVAEVLAEFSGPRAALVRIGIPSEFSPVVGDQAFLRDRYGLTADAIARRVEAVLERTGTALTAGV